MVRVVAAIVVLVFGPTLASERLPLDVPVAPVFRITDPRLLRPCDFGLVVAQIAHASKIPMGFENTRDCSLTLRGVPHPDTAGTEDLAGRSPRQALDHLMTFMPAFSWKEIDGVIVVRPQTAWSDPHNVLSSPTGAFDVVDQTLDDAVHTLLHATGPKTMVPHTDVANPERRINRRVNVAFHGGTLLDALNAMSRSRAGLDWALGYSAPGFGDIQIGSADIHDGIVGAPIAVPLAKP